MSQSEAATSQWIHLQHVFTRVKLTIGLVALLIPAAAIFLLTAAPADGAEFQPRAATSEPAHNDTPAEAVTITVGTPITGTFDAPGDYDWYRFTIGDPGKLSVRLDPPAGGGNWATQGTTLVQVCNATGQACFGSGSAGASTESAAFEMWFDPTDLGEYRVYAHSPNGYSTEPYTLTTNLDVLPPIWPDEPGNNSPISTTVVLTLGQSAPNFFANLKTGSYQESDFAADYDWYQLTISDPGKLSVRLDPPAGGGNWATQGTMLVQVCDAVGQVCYGTGTAGSAGESATSEVEFDSAQVGEYRVYAHSPNGYSTEPYTLTTSFEARDTPLFRTYLPAVAKSQVVGW